MTEGAIGEVQFVSIEFGGERGITENTLFVPFVGKSNGVTFDGMSDQMISAGTIRLSEIGAIVFAMDIGAGGVKAIAITEGNAAIPKTFACAGLFAFAGFCAQFISKDFGECTEDGEDEFPPRGRKVEVFSDGNKGDLVLVQVMQRGEQTTEVTVKAIDGMHNHDIKVVLFCPGH